MTGTGAPAGNIAIRGQSPRPGLRVSKKAGRDLISSAMAKGDSSGESRNDSPLVTTSSALPRKTSGMTRPRRQTVNKLGSGKTLPAMESGSRARFLRHGDAVVIPGRRGGAFTAPVVLLTISLRPVIPRQVARQQSPPPLHRLYAIFKL